VGDFWVPIFDILAAAGLPVGVNDINEGYERRSRSSGGFDGPPLAVQWHHTASQASVSNDLNYMINGSPDEPVGNVLADRDGFFWPVAAGAANTSGKGGPCTFSRGTCPKDSGNTRLFSIEIANSGVGERYSQVQIDNCFIASNALNAHFGNRPDDVIPHSLAEGTGYTDRKIDPATTDIEGPWQPRGVNSSGTWSHADLKAECDARSVSIPPPPIPDPEEDEVPSALLRANSGTPEQQEAVWWWDGKQIGWVRTGTIMSVGIVCGLYANMQPPLSNFNHVEIQALIDSGWIGGPVPPGYHQPTFDTGVT
jgi:hypothetical protein